MIGWWESVSELNKHIQKREDGLNVGNAAGEEESRRQATGWRNLTEHYFRHRYSILFLTLLLTLVAAPVAAEYQLRGDLIEILLLLNLSAAALGADKRRHRNALIALILLAVLLRFLGRLLQFESASTIGALLWVALTVTAAVMALRFALRGRSIDMEHMAAALSAYLLAGHFFGVIYKQIAELNAGAFTISGTASALGQLDLQTSIYFSFVTLATLGYGDITPLSPVARGFAITEAVMGQLYLAVLVARLVSAYSRPR